MRRADRFWLGQVLLVLLVLLLTVGLAISRQLELIDRLLTACQSASQALADAVWAFISLAPFSLGGLSLILMGLSISRQLWATRRLLQVMGPVSPLPEELVALGEDLGLAGRLQLVTDPRPFAFCAGLVRPGVWLTTGLLSALDREALVAVLRHEGHHLWHRDPLKLLLVRALGDAFFFLPLVRELGRAYEIHKELAADAEATLLPAGQIGLARALLQLSGTPSVDLARAAAGPLLLSQGDGTTKARLDQLIRGVVPSVRPRSRSIWLTGLAVVLLLFLGLSPLAGTVHAEWGGSCGSEDKPTLLWLEVP